jgi:hypothetical protein
MAGAAQSVPSCRQIGVKTKMNDEKRMVDTYEVLHAVHVGDKEILFGVDERKKELPYMVCNCTLDNPLGIEQYFDAAGSADYLEMMTEFVTRVAAQVEAVKGERDKITVPLEPFTIGQCTANDYGESIENRLVVIRPDCLRPEYRTADKQLVLAEGGFGAHANSRGRAVYTVNLYSGKKSRWNREDFLGAIKPECLPEWAGARLRQIQDEEKDRQKKQEFER